MARDEKPTEDIKLLLGRRVRELRERAGLTQSQLANAATVSRVYLGVVERGEKEAGISVVAKLAVGLGVEPAELFRVDARGAAKPDPAARLAQKIVSLARGSSPSALGKFEKIARVYFEPEGADKRAPSRGRRRG